MTHAVLFDRRGKPTLDWAQATRNLARADAELGSLIKQVGPFAMSPRPLTSVYEALGTAILRQQVSGAAADSIHRKLNAQYDAKRFPAAEQIARATAEELRKAGVSGSKARSLIELAQKTAAGEVPEPKALHLLHDDAIMDALVVHRGIGRWTVEMLLMFRMGRPDVFPVDDYGVKKGFQLTFGMKKLPHKTTMLRRAERWRPFRTIAAWYMWRACEL
ncbi:MAG: DNA-3-methyladenine glycosylase 2 family protein [Deltaproteobacteria bacterium]|nr:DNA-3-methyladenine glycosylase 2 family protein [Deltaproteobacteria bacterium]